MNWMNYLAIILLSVFLAANANAQENDPLGSATDAAAKEDIGETMADDLFNPAAGSERQRHTGDNGKECA